MHENWEEGSEEADHGELNNVCCHCCKVRDVLAVSAN